MKVKELCERWQCIDKLVKKNVLHPEQVCVIVVGE